MVAERFYLVFRRRGLSARVLKRVYFLLGRPRWIPRLWARGEREWSRRMFDEQLADSGLL